MRSKEAGSSMKKLILITGILLSTSLWASPMDSVCSIETQSGYLTGEDYERIEAECERNNILFLLGLEVEFVPYMRVQFCRYDRNVDVLPYGFDNKYSISCVLYDNKPREQIK
jgi:hypothetical protein